MPSVCLYFQAHQPYRLRPLDFFSLGTHADYFDEPENRAILDRVSEKCYLPANALFQRLIEESDGAFRLAYSLSGVFLDQLERYRPDVLESFQKLVATGGVELLGETWSHSLAASHGDEAEFKAQVQAHTKLIERLFGQTPTVFRNTELIYWDDLCPRVKDLGFNGILTEGVDWFLDERTPNQVFKPSRLRAFGLLLKNYKLSDDIAFRFSNRHWPDYPLTPLKFAGWLAEQPGETINLFMDYETIGEHHWADTGIFEFWEHLPKRVLEAGLSFKTPAETLAAYKATESYLIERPISWADKERDLSAWIGNPMQQEAIARLYRMDKRVKASGNEEILATWRRLQCSDHLYYMSTKTAGDGQVHGYFRPYESAYDSYIYFMNALSDLEIQLEGLE